MTELATTETRHSTAGFDLSAAGVTPPLNPNRRGVFLADVIVELGLADQATIDQAIKAAQETEKSLERHLLEAGILDEVSLSLAIAERNGLDLVDLAEFDVDMEAAQMVARSAAKRYGAVPVAFASDGALIVAVEDPFDTLGISDIEVMTRSSVRPAIATHSGIEALVERLPDQAVERPPVEEPIVEEPPTEETPLAAAIVEEPSVEVAPDPSSNGHFEPPPAFEIDVPETELAIPEIEPIKEVEPMVEFEQETEFEPATEIEPMVEFEQETEFEPATEIEPMVEFEPATEIEPVVEFEPPLETIAEEVAEPEPEPETEHELVQFPEPPKVEPELELVSPPEAAASGARMTDLEGELGSLQETARRADELATSVERRIAELTSADERSARLEADLLAAQQRVGELEGQVSGVDTLAEELRATTAKLEGVNRVLEGSVR